jgi:toxin-antitoxin system PIN domain toxin
MIAVDTNILVYAHREEFSLHLQAKDRLIALAENPDPWALPVFCMTEFLRVVTHPKLFDPPTAVEEAAAAIGNLLESPSLLVLTPGENFWRLLNDTIQRSGVRGNLIYDAQIVAVCREYGVADVLSEDRDFTRFDSINLHTLA